MKTLTQLKTEVEKLEKQTEFNNSFFLGKIIYCANRERHFQLEITTLSYHSKRDASGRRIIINKFYYVPEEQDGILTYLNEVGETGYFKNCWKCFSSEEEAKKHYARKKIECVAKELEKVVEEIIEIRYSFFEENKENLEEKAKKLSRFLTT